MSSTQQTTTDDNKSPRVNTIVNHLRLIPSFFGEVHISELKFNTYFLDITEERKSIIKDSLIQFQGNILPIIVRKITDPNYQYEVLFGDEVCFVAKEFCQEIGSAESDKLRINRLRVYLLENIPHSEIATLQEKLGVLLHYDPQKYYTKQIKSKETYDNLVRALNDKDKDKLHSLIKDPYITVSTLRKFIRLNIKLKMKASELNIKVNSPFITADKLISVVHAITQSWEG